MMMMACLRDLNGCIFLLAMSSLIVWLTTYHASATDCEKVWEKPMILASACVIVVSLAGLFGYGCRLRWLLWTYLLALVLVLLFLLGFSVFISSEVTFNRHLGAGHSSWLERRVINNWNMIKPCLQQDSSSVCKRMANPNHGPPNATFVHHSLSSLQSGCCKPPNDCNMTYVSPTKWIQTTNVSSTNPDCGFWNNDVSILCYNCQSCKAALVNKLQFYSWVSFAACLIFEILIIIAVLVHGRDFMRGASHVSGSTAACESA